MIIKLIPLIILSISISLILMPNPLILGVWIFILTVRVSITISILSSWFAMIFFLIYVGGLLVLFAYFLAIQPNQFTGISTLILFTSFRIIFLNSIFTITYWSSFTHSTPNITFIIHNSNIPTIILLATLLLLILVIVVKITSFKSGPLRPFL